MSSILEASSGFSIPFFSMVSPPRCTVTVTDSEFFSLELINVLMRPAAREPIAAIAPAKMITMPPLPLDKLLVLLN